MELMSRFGCNDCRCYHEEIVKWQTAAGVEGCCLAICLREAPRQEEVDKASKFAPMEMPGEPPADSQIPFHEDHP